mmetsp:Transcript_3272/g.9604  ORF Transcript_3272/g.9604 Transcript_3272/m.9604 type:complete len:98 (+) Transcript_3272:131-424(+)
MQDPVPATATGMATIFLAQRCQNQLLHQILTLVTPISSLLLVQMFLLLYRQRLRTILAQTQDHRFQQRMRNRRPLRIPAMPAWTRQLHWDMVGTRCR